MTRSTGALRAGRPALPIGLAAILITFAIDQITKLFALVLLSGGEAERLLPFLDLRLSFNEGVSFGIFSQAFAGRPLALAAITCAIVILFTAFLFRSSSWREAVALGAVIGGALGNILDRLRVGAVVDFIDLHLWGYHWPAFNVADSAIVVGVSAFVLASFASGPRTAVR